MEALKVPLSKHHLFLKHLLCCLGNQQVVYFFCQLNICSSSSTTIPELFVESTVMDSNIMEGLDALTKESEMFTPLKLEPAFQIAEDESESVEGAEDVLEKIPHGLTSKKQRRQSFNHHSHFHESLAFSPRRFPLTSPRPNVLNARPIINYEDAKKSLTRDLENLKDGKENMASGVKSALNINTSNAEEMSPYDTRIGTKRLSLDGYAESARKHQRCETDVTENNDIMMSFNESSIFEESFNLSEGEHVSTSADNAVDEDSTSVQSREVPESLSRIETVEINSLNNINLLKVQETSLNPITPCRITEPKPVSPKTEQCSRIVDESALLLDTSKSPIVDDSYLMQSPLSQHNTTMNDKEPNILDSLHEAEEEESTTPIATELPKHVLGLGPKLRPFFSVSQVHEIQAEFSNETERLETAIGEKSSEILSLHDRIHQQEKTIYVFKDQIGSVELEKKQLQKRNQLFQIEYDMFKNDINELEAILKVKEEKLARQSVAIDAFKQRVRELGGDIKLKNDQIQNLKSDLENSQSSIKKLEVTLQTDSDRIETLSKDAEQQQVEQLRSETALKEEIKNLYQELESTKENVKSLEGIQAEMEESLRAKSREYEASKLGLESSNQRLINIESESSKLYKASEIQRTDIAALKALVNSKDHELKEYQVALQNSGKKISLNKAIIDGSKAAIITLQNERTSLRYRILKSSDEITTLSKKLEDAQELLTIRKAEVDELNFELKSFKEEIQMLRSAVTRKDDRIEELETTLMNNVRGLDERNDKIQELEEFSQAQEAEHLSELESFHKEMSNVQNVLSSRSNDLFRLKEEKEILNKEHDLLKYELQSLREEFGDSETRINNLKGKLQNSKTKNQELESTIEKLKKENTQLEKETDKRLQQLAEDLYVQYSKKHEQKVQVLKKGYETKWQSKLNKAEGENEKLRREIDGLNAQLETEQKEKSEVIKLWDKLKEAESTVGEI